MGGPERSLLPAKGLVPRPAAASRISPARTPYLVIPARRAYHILCLTLYAAMGLVSGVKMRSLPSWLRD